MPVIEVIARTQTKRYPFTGEKFVLGRAADCGAVIDDDTLISRRHCEVVRLNDGYALRDLKSRNGTRVLGQTVDAVKLVDAGVFQLGNTYVRFFASRASADAAPPGRHPGTVSARPAEPKHRPAGAPPSVDALMGRGPGGVGGDPAGGDDDEPVYDVAELVGDDAHPSAAGTPATPAAAAAAGQVALGGGASNVGALGRIGTDPGFGIESLALLDARGETVHAAGAELSDAQEALAHLQLLVLGAIRCAASDIHLEPRQHSAAIRLRVDGAMLEVCTVSADAARRLMSLIKVLCNIDVSRKSVIQEGHFSLQAPGRNIDYRVSFAPAMYGQKMVVRVLDPMSSPQTLHDLAMPPAVMDAVKATTDGSTGMLLVCGPTGSGKTTTLYAALRGIDAGVRNVITIEDPIEYEIGGVTQIPVDTHEGHTFGVLLRTCLRQDPDVIVLGEVRDQDTAVTAMQAATTGHLVLSTLHATDTVSTVLRLLDLGVEPYLISSTLNVVLAQRLLRKLCEGCREPVEVTDTQKTALGLKPEDNRIVHQPVGCERCFGTGYAGRVGVFELLATDDKLRDLILNKPSLVDLRTSLAENGFKTLADHAAQRVLDGTCSYEDAARVVGFAT